MIDHRATINRYDSPMHVRTSTGTQVNGQSGYIFRLTHAAEQTITFKFVAEIIEDLLGHLAAKKPRCDRVNRDVFRSKLYSEVSSQMMNCCFAGRVSVGADSVHSRNMQTVY